MNTVFQFLVSASSIFPANLRFIILARHLLAAACLATIFPAGAGELPLWEIGLGGGALTIPEYRGAPHNREYAFPVILPFYRGRMLKVDEDGVRGVLHQTPAFVFDISFDGTPPVDSERNGLRTGMPDLDATLHVGPMARFRLWGEEAYRQSLWLNLPLRAAFSVSTDDIEHVGYSASPHLTYYRHLDWLGESWRLGLSAGFEFGDGGLHDYFYSVPGEFATASRSAYDAEGGYAGTRLIATFLTRTDHWWISFFARYDGVNGAVFDDSPLVGRHAGVTAGFVLTRLVARSDRSVLRDGF